MILSAATIRAIQPVRPFCERTIHNGRSYGLSHAGYDVRIKQDVFLRAGEFSLASTVEHFEMPDDVLAIVHDKSTWARQGLSVFNTVIEPGWHGWLTLELKNQHHTNHIKISAGDPIAQIVFQRLDTPTDPYRGKYFWQPDRPVEAILERSAK